MKNISITVEENGSIRILKITGEIDTETHDFLRHELDKVMKAGAIKFILDLSGVEYISSAGWSDFCSHALTLRGKAGDLKLAAMQEQMKELYKMVGFDEVLKSYDSVQDAIRAF